MFPTYHSVSPISLGDLLKSQKVSAFACAIWEVTIFGGTPYGRYFYGMCTLTAISVAEYVPFEEVSSFGRCDVPIENGCLTAFKTFFPSV